MPQHQDWVRAYYTDVWEKQDPSAIDTYFSPDVRGDGAFGDQTMTREDIREAAGMIEAFYDRVSISILRYVENGDTVAALMEMTADIVDSGPTVCARGQLFATIANAQFVEFYHSFDYVHLYQQTGQMPEDTMALMVSGQSLRFGDS